MNYENESWYRLNRMPTGRRIVILSRLRREAEAGGLPAELLQRCDRLIIDERNLLAQHKAYQVSQATTGSGVWSTEILDLDALLDPALVELRDTLELQARRPHTAKGAASKGLLEEHFALNVTWYTHATIEDEDERVGLLLAQLAADGERVRAAGIGELAEEITDLHRPYAQKIKEHRQAQPLAFEPLRQAELAGHRSLLGVLGHVLHVTDELAPEARVAQRKAVLAELVRQNAEVTALIRQKRRLTDVDPDAESPTA